MRSTGIDRRLLLRRLGAAAVLAATRPAVAGTDARPLLVSAARRGDGTYVAAGIGDQGDLLFEATLPDRGHGAAVDPERRRAVVFARRPGRFAIVIDLARGEPVARIDSIPGRHFQGHGLFSADGRHLYGAENDHEGERGVIGVYDAVGGFPRVGEVDAYGLDTHEMILLKDGRTIAAANGGILTHPDYPRAKLNLAGMEPSLVFLDAGSGALLARVEPPPALRRLSIRHLAEGHGGWVWFGCQYEGPADDAVPLVGRVRPGDRAVDWIRPGPDPERALRQYVGSVAATGDGTRLAVSSPPGGTCLVFDAIGGGLEGAWHAADVCGLAGPGAALIASDGTGMLRRDGAAWARHAGLAWDNHLAKV